MATEELRFKVGLSGTYWDRRPQYEILVNNEVKKSGTIVSESGIVEYIEFSAEVEEDVSHTLQIRLIGKVASDVVQNKNGNIEKDLLLNIVEIEIDDIELEFLKWTHSKYIPDEPKEGFPSNMHVNLGWNGTYELKFNSPFYIWVLESM